MENIENNGRRTFFIEVGEMTNKQAKEYLDSVKDAFTSKDTSEKDI